MLYLSLPLWTGCDYIQVLYGLWSGRSSGYGHVRFTQWISEGRDVAINGDGSQRRGFTYLDDIARGTILGLKPVGYEIINLGGHELITLNDLIAILEKKIGKEGNHQIPPIP